MTTDRGHLNGDPTVLQLDRAIGELRRGRALALSGAHGGAVVAAAEMLRQPLLERLRATGARILVVLTPQRAAALGLEGRHDTAAALPVPAHWDAADLRALAGASAPAATAAVPEDWHAAAASAAMGLALRFAKAGRLLPALLQRWPRRWGPTWRRLRRSC